MVKSPDPLDPQRLEVTRVDVMQTVDPARSHVFVNVTFVYEPWWGEPGQDVLWEQANAMLCIREALQRGGVGSDF